jgi:hypothetical protein
MRMRAHVEPGSRTQRGRAHLIEEYKRPDRAVLWRWQDAADLEPVAEVAGLWNNHSLEHRAHDQLRLPGMIAKIGADRRMS